MKITEVDGPGFNPPFVATSAYEANWIRSWAVEMCQDNNLEAVSFDHVTVHQFKKRFTVTAEGIMSTDMDLSLQREREETKRTHG